MRHIILGAGSIGQRHLRNLKSLHPDDEFITVDTNGKADYTNLADVYVAHAIVYICTPMECHSDQIGDVYFRDARAIFVEKPLFGTKKGDGIYFTPEDALREGVPIACGYNYRFHPLFRELKAQSVNNIISYLHFYGSENLVGKYGPTALGTMASHSIDLALWLLGDMMQCQLEDYGTYCFIGLRHKNKSASHIFASMRSSFRVASCTVLHLSEEDIDAVFRGEATKYTPGREHYFIEPDDQMYIDEMKAWLNYVDTGDPGKLCTLEQALKVQEVMRGK